MMHPDYVYTPLSAATREKMRDASRKRRGIPKGYREMYGVYVPERQYDEIMPLAAYVRKYVPGDLEAVQVLIRTLVRQHPLVQPQERKRLMVALMALANLDAQREKRARKHPPS